MGEINIPHDQQTALEAIDLSELERLIESAVREERSDDLYRLALAKCGPHISTQLYYFEQALAKHRLAKAPRKRTQTGEALRRAGRDLSFAVGATKQRMEKEQKEAELFFVDDQIAPPYHFSKNLTVRVGYRWRGSANDQWKIGSITFIHDVDLRPDHAAPVPKRKPSAAKRERDLQGRLFQTWEHLLRDALCSVRDYFRGGGDGDKIPDTFRVNIDPRTHGLNNYSTKFWREQR